MITIEKVDTFNYRIKNTLFERIDFECPSEDPLDILIMAARAVHRIELAGSR